MNGVSIIVCTYNGEQRLPETLKYISEIQFAEEWELLVVDNASRDLTCRMVDDFLKNNQQLQGRVITESQPGLSRARKRGWQNAKYDVVLFCDDDNWLGPDYLSIGFDLFKSNPKMGVLGGLGIPVSDSSFPDWFPEFSHSFAVGTNGKTSGKLERGAAHYGAGCFFLKEPLIHLESTQAQLILTDRKGNELVSGGDVELCFLVQLQGYEIWFEQSLKFRHFIPSRRLEWDYYLKLKKGIAASFPLLFSYKAIFHQRSQPELKSEILQKFWYSIKGYFLGQLLKIIRPSKRNEVQLVENRQKISSFFRNYRATLSHYHWLAENF